MATPRSREKEAKFSVTDSTGVIALTENDTLTPDYCLHTRGVVTHADTYFDTPTYSLLRAGYALRVRTTAEGYLLGLKSLSTAYTGEIHDREEIEAAGVGPQPPTALKQWPTALADALAGICNPPCTETAEWQAVAHLRQTRHKRDVSLVVQPDANLLELSVDRVEVFAAQPTDDSPPLATLDEVEVELMDSTAESALQHVAQRLRSLPDLRPVLSSKLERALLVIASHAPDQPPGVLGILPEMPVAEACRTIWREQLLRILLLEHDARRGDRPEAVHQMRVAIRRMRAAHRLFGGFFRKRSIRPYMTTLKQLGGRLGAVRDLDVGIINLIHFRSRLSKSDRKAVKEIVEDLRRKQAAAHSDLVKFFDSTAYTKFITGFDRFCRTPGAGVKPADAQEPGIAPSQVRHTLPSIILARFEAVRAYETLADLPQPPAYPTLHALRIQAKYLRYSLEFSRPLLGKDGDRLIAQLKRLQDHLGALNDAHVEQQRLQEWRLRYAKNPAITLRLADLEITMARLTEEYPPPLAKFVGPRNRGRLAKAITRL